MALDGLSGLGGMLEDVKTTILEKPFITGGVALGVVTGGVLAAKKVLKKKRISKSTAKKKKVKDRKKRSPSVRKKKSGRKLKFGSPAWRKKYMGKGKKKKQKQPYTAGKGKDTSTRRIRFTKNNQPYVILKSGKARFIKKSSVARMRKLKGGKY